MPISLHHELKYGTPEHKRLADAVYARYRLSEEAMSDRRTKWTRAEDLFLAYKPETAEDARKRARRDSSGTVEYTTVVLPYSYAILMTAVTYWSSVFLGRSPVFQYTGRNGASQQKVQGVEALVDYQLLMDSMTPKLFAWLLDAGKYGVGVLWNHWTEDYITYSQLVETADALGNTTRQRVVTQSRQYAGNSVFNVRPYDFFPDPRVPLMDFQRGEFCGRYVEVSLPRLRASQEGYFNLDKAKDAQGSEAARNTGSSQLQMPGTRSGALWNVKNEDTGLIPCIELVMEISPDEWGLGESPYPEKWVFTLVLENKALIGCRPQGMAHGRFPAQILTYEVDPYSFTLRGMMEICEPLANTLDWLFNSHFFNVRKAMNDQLVVDPLRVEMTDLKAGGPGRLIRLRPEAYGSSVQDVVRQLPVMDVTASHLASVKVVIEMYQRLTGVSDNLMGMMNMRGGRTTAAEVRTSTSMGVNRMKTFCEFNSALGFAPLSQMFVQNNQQFLDEELELKIAGDLLMGNPQFLKVAPADIAGFYDYVPVDGTLPIDRFAQANLWKEILMGLGQMPTIATGYDIAGIFSWMAQMAGLKNINQFKLNVMPDMAAQAASAQGKLVPIGQGRSEQATRGTAPAATGLGSAPIV